MQDSIFQPVTDSTHLRSILDSMVVQIAYLHEGTHTVGWANQAARSAWGLLENQVPGKICHQVFEGSLVPCHGCPKKQVLEDNLPHERQVQVSDKHFIVRMNPVRNQYGQVVGLVEVRQDITHRITAEQKRRELKLKLERLQKAESLGQMAGGIAHDFNNLLMGILGNTSLALEEVDSTSSVADSLQEIHQAAQRAAQISKKMLAYTGQAHFSVDIVNLNEIIRQLMQEITPVLPMHIALISDLDRDLPLLPGGAQQVRQVVESLVDNAIEALDTIPGAITLRTRERNLEQEFLFNLHTGANLASGRYVQLEVIDTGPGIGPKTLEKIFDPFFTTKFIGRGLGLSATLGIVKGHKGSIEVESQLNRGCVFRVLLPIQPQTTQPAVAQRSTTDIQEVKPKEPGEEHDPIQRQADRADHSIPWSLVSRPSDRDPGG